MNTFESSTTNELLLELFGTSYVIYKIILIAIPVIIFLIFIKLCAIKNRTEKIITQQEFTNDFLIKQIQQNQEIINLLKTNNTKPNEQENQAQL